jgi:hypothetical protein
MVLRAVNPGLRARDLFRRGMSGRPRPHRRHGQHRSETSFSSALNSEVVASQIVATLVGSMGLIAAVPITTGLASLLVVHIAPTEASGHVH